MAQREPNKFDLRRAATHATLLQLGIERLPIKGYAGTSIEDLVHDSGLTRGAFHFHFDSREEYFLAVLRERAARRAGWWELPETPEIDSLDAAVARALGNLAGVGDGGTHDWLPLVIEFAQSVRTDPAYEPRLERLYAEWIDELTLLTDYLHSRGWVRTDRTPRELAQAIFAYAEGSNMHRELFGATVDALMLEGLVRLLQP